MALDALAAAAAEGTAASQAPPDPRPPRDQLAAFRPAIFGILIGTTAMSVVLASTSFADGDRWVVFWCGVVVAYAAYRLIWPMRYVGDTASLLRVLTGVAIHVFAVTATGYWDSPFVFSLLTVIIVAGFARGYGFAVRIGLVSALAVSLPVLSDTGGGADELRTAAQWTILLLLVGIVAGFARRVVGEVDRQHLLAMDRLGRLADANALLFSLHRVAQTLPASLDLDEVLDSTMSRVRDLFRYDAAALLLFDETGGSWQVARWEGHRLPERLEDRDLPPALHAAIDRQGVVVEPNLLRHHGPALVPSMNSGLYAVLPARHSVVGIIALEHRGDHRFGAREFELLSGFVEPAALAIDNARWFARLRTVGADEERTRIARDLHDRIGQSLAYLAIEIDRILKSSRDARSVTEPLDRLRNDVRGVIGEVRDTLYDLRTDVSEDQDLPTTLRAFLARVRERSGLDAEVVAHEAGRLPLLQEREFWRIAQEAVTNIERHARANWVRINWRCDGQSAALEVVDDGCGFPVDTAGRLDSYGLVGMRERAASIGASLVIDSVPGRGTIVRSILRPPERGHALAPVTRGASHP